MQKTSRTHHGLRLTEPVEAFFNRPDYREMASAFKFIRPNAPDATVSGEHRWRMTFYKWGMPLAVMTVADRAITSWGSSFGWLHLAILCTFLFLWILTLVRPALSIAATDITLTGIIWISVVYSLAGLYLTDGHEAADTLEHLLFWMPFITLYWALVFTDRIWLVAVMVFIFVSFLLGAEHITRQKLGIGIFHGPILRTLVQELMVLVLATAFGYMARKVEATRREQKKSFHDTLHDELTGIPNRVAFEMDLIRHAAVSRRYGTPLSLALVKIDNLQSLNRDFGRDAGDEVLVEVAKALRAALREADFVGRWSDDEFIMLLPGVPVEHARQGVERASRKAVESGECLYGPIALYMGMTSVYSHESLAEPASRLAAAVAQARAGGSRTIEVVR